LIPEVREAAVVEVNSETDFVARNEQFQQLVRNVGKVALAHDGKTELVAAAKYPGSDKSVTEVDQGRSGHHRREHRLPPLGQADTVSMARSRLLCPQRGCRWPWQARRPRRRSKPPATSTQRMLFARQVAMHVAATNPLALTAEQIDPSAVEREKAIFSDQARVGQAGSDHREDGRGPLCASSTRKSCS
jgi:elongation factor Ts